MISCDFRNGRYLSCSTIFRGKVAMKEVENQLRIIQQLNSPHSIKNIPNNMQMALCSVPTQGFDMSSTFVGNSIAIQHTFKRIGEQFSAIFRRRAYLVPYWRDGMDEMEFTEAEYNVNDLVSEYQEC